MEVEGDITATQAPPNLFRIIIGGNIGAGKSSVIDALSRESRPELGRSTVEGASRAVSPTREPPPCGPPPGLLAPFNQIANGRIFYVFTREPVDEWAVAIKDMYEAKDGHDRSIKTSIFQVSVIMHFYKSMQAVNKHAWRVYKQDPTARVCHVMERSMHDAASVFIPVGIAQNSLEASHASMLSGLIDSLYPSPMDFSGACLVGHASYLFLDVDAETCCRRIAERSRDGEGAIPEEYIRMLDERHRNSLMNDLESVGVRIYYIKANVKLSEVIAACASTITKAVD